MTFQYQNTSNSRNWMYKLMRWFRGEKMYYKFSGAKLSRKSSQSGLYRCTIGERTGKHSRWLKRWVQWAWSKALFLLTENWSAGYFRIREKCRKKLFIGKSGEGGYFLTWLHYFINSISLIQRLPWREKLDTRRRGIDFMCFTLS